MTRPGSTSPRSPKATPTLRAEVEGGQFFLLSDHQIHWEGEQKQSWNRVVAEVTDRAGLEELATIQIDFDPTSDTRQPHPPADPPRRPGHRPARPRVSPQVYRRETRLEEGIIDGTLTAVVQVPDLRVGDVLEQATLLESRPVIGAGERSGSSWLEWSTPVVLSRTAPDLAQGPGLEVGPLPDRVTYTTTDLGDGTVRHDWRRENHIPPHRRRRRARRGDRGRTPALFRHARLDAADRRAGAALPAGLSRCRPIGR